MEKLTAVQWLALRYHHSQGYLSQDDIAEARVIEKEQIIDAFNDGDFMSCGSEKDAIDYYNYLYSNENTSTKAD